MMPLELAVLGLAGLVAPDVVTTWLPHPATTVAAPAAAAMSTPARVRRPERVTGTPMVISVPVYAARDQAGNECVQGTERRPGPLSALNYKHLDVREAPAVPFGKNTPRSVARPLARPAGRAAGLPRPGEAASSPDQTPAACIPRSSCFSSLISSRIRAATSNCNSAAAVCICSVSWEISAIRSP